jgi:copper chaperone CopZ
MLTTTYAGLLVSAAMLWMPAIAAAGNCSIDKGAECAASAPATLQARPGEKLYVLGIEGMSCADNCAPKVKESIQSIDGVREVEVSFQDKRAIVHTDPDVELTTTQVDQSFKNHGYFVSSLRAVAPN